MNKEIKQQLTEEEEKALRTDNPNHPSKHKNDKDLMTAEEIENYSELEFKTDTINLGS